MTTSCQPSRLVVPWRTWVPWLPLLATSGASTPARKRPLPSSLLVKRVVGPPMGTKICPRKTAANVLTPAKPMLVKGGGGVGTVVSLVKGQLSSVLPLALVLIAVGATGAVAVYVELVVVRVSKAVVL